MSAPTVEQLLAERVDGRHRGFGAVADGLTVEELGAQGYDLRRGDLPLPLLVLRASALEHNLRTMHGWCAERGLSLAPHGKTTMAPQLVRRQLDAGAWGMTAATVQQLAVMRAAGARRVIVANEVVGAAEIAALARERAAGCDVYCLVDSVAGVRQLDEGLAADTASAPLGVLVELGGGRAGCRSDAEAYAVVAAVEAAPRLVLAGVEGYEGTFGSDRQPATIAAADALLDRVRELTVALDARGAFAELP
jgi:D-serine deaminase-like pyridoxal phosphate-dependent protein